MSNMKLMTDQNGSVYPLALPKPTSTIVNIDLVASTNKAITLPAQNCHIKFIDTTTPTPLPLFVRFGETAITATDITPESSTAGAMMVNPSEIYSEAETTLNLYSTQAHTVSIEFRQIKTDPINPDILTTFNNDPLVDNSNDPYTT